MCDLNFAVRSRHAASVSLCLARQSTDAQSKVGYIEIALDPLVNKTGNGPIFFMPHSHSNKHSDKLFCLSSSAHGSIKMRDSFKE